MSCKTGPFLQVFPLLGAAHFDSNPHPPLPLVLLLPLARFRRSFRPTPRRRFRRPNARSKEPGLCRRCRWISSSSLHALSPLCLSRKCHRFGRDAGWDKGVIYRLINTVVRYNLSFIIWTMSVWKKNKIIVFQLAEQALVYNGILVNIARLILKYRRFFLGIQEYQLLFLPYFRFETQFA